MSASRAGGWGVWGMGGLPRIARGDGSYLFDTEGRRYLDGSGGPAAFSLGHGNREVNAAIARSSGRWRAAIATSSQASPWRS